MRNILTRMETEQCLCLCNLDPIEQCFCLMWSMSGPRRHGRVIRHITFRFLKSHLNFFFRCKKFAIKSMLKKDTQKVVLTHISLGCFLWDICKQNSPRCDAAKCGVPSGAILFAYVNFIENEIKMKNHS